MTKDVDLTPEQKAEEEKSPWFTPEEIAALPPVRPMTPEEEAEYAEMERLMNIYDGGGPIEEEKSWFERDHEVHDRER
jgi:hypothetical protein